MLRRSKRNIYFSTKKRLYLLSILCVISRQITKLTKGEFDRTLDY